MSLVLMRLSETTWKHRSHLEDWKTHTRAFRSLDLSSDSRREKNRTTFSLLNRDMLAMIQVVLLLILRNHWQYVTHVFLTNSPPPRPLPFFFFLTLSTPGSGPCSFLRDIDPCCAPEHLHCISAERLCTEGTCPIIGGTGHSSKRWRGTGALACFMRLTSSDASSEGEAERIVWLCDNNCDSETEEL
jgi:hypothetical protein